MKLNYHKDTDSLYIDLSSMPSTDSREISEGIVLDYDANGHVTGIDIDNGSNKVDFDHTEQAPHRSNTDSVMLNDWVLDLKVKKAPGHKGKHATKHSKTFGEPLNCIWNPLRFTGLPLGRR